MFAENFEQMFAFYNNLLGLTVAKGDVNSDYAEFETGDAKIAIYKQKKLPKVIQAKFSKNKPLSLIALRVENLKSAVAFLEEKKASFLVAPTKNQEAGIESFYLEDPQGNLLEIYSNLE